MLLAIGLMCTGFVVLMALLPVIVRNIVVYEDELDDRFERMRVLDGGADR